MLISHLDERKTKRKLLAKHKDCYLKQLLTKTNKKQTKRSCSSTKPAQESNFNGKVISLKRHSPCLELCIAHAFGSCAEVHLSSCPDVVALVQVEKVVHEHIGRIKESSERDRFKEELKEVMTSIV